MRRLSEGTNHSMCKVKVGNEKGLFPSNAMLGSGKCSKLPYSFWCLSRLYRILYGTVSLRLPTFSSAMTGHSPFSLPVLFFQPIPAVKRLFDRELYGGDQYEPPRGPAGLVDPSH